MTQATDQDIRELKIAIEAIGKGTEANTKEIANLTASVSGAIDWFLRSGKL
jgi:hypothetical protein